MFKKQTLLQYSFADKVRHGKDLQNSVCVLYILLLFWFSQDCVSIFVSLQMTLRQLSEAHGTKAGNSGKFMAHIDKEHSCRIMQILLMHSKYALWWSPVLECTVMMAWQRTGNTLTKTQNDCMPGSLLEEICRQLHLP